MSGAVTKGLLTEVTMDRALRRLYEGLVRAGYFDPASSSPYRTLGWSDVNTAEAQALAIQSAADGIVLKKNSGFLPMDLSGKSVALIGHWANGTRAMLGGYSGTPPYYHGPVYAAQELGLKFYYATGPINQSTSANDTWTLNALAAAANADVVLYFGGIALSIESEDLDRYSIALPGAQLALVERLASLGKPLVVVQLGDQTDDAPLLRNGNVSAVLWAGFPGQSGGTAVFDVLTGKTAPAGRLPVTQYPASYVNEVSLLDMGLRPSEKNPGRTFMWYNGSVLPFGHGLHYTSFRASLRRDCLMTTFDIGELRKNCLAGHPDLCRFASIPVQVENSGSRKSDFVALAFLSGEYGPKPYPIKTLAGYIRLRDVNPGSATTTSIPMTLGTLARVDAAGDTVLYPGTYNLLVDVPTQDEVSFTLTGDPWVLDRFPQPPP